jgi:hypothetical protein
MNQITNWLTVPLQNRTQTYTALLGFGIISFVIWFVHNGI